MSGLVVSGYAERYAAAVAEHGQAAVDADPTLVEFAATLEAFRDVEIEEGDDA